MKFNPEAVENLSPAEKEEFERDWARYQEAVQRNPLIGYEPHAKQADFHTAKTKFKAFIAGNRSGKTTAGVADDLIQACDRDAVPDHLRPFKKWDPPFKCRIFTPDLGATRRNIIQKFNELSPRGQLEGGTFDRAYHKAENTLYFANGSTVEFTSYGMDREQLGSVALHRIHYDEEPGGEGGEEIRQEGLWRLVDYGGDEIYTLTPFFGYGWVKDEIWDRRHESNVTCVKGSVFENPHVSQEEVKQTLDLARTKEERDARAYGDFVHFGGRFYEEFSDELLVDAPTPDHLADQTIVVGIDPGLRRTGIVWVAFDNDNACLVFDEFYPEEMVVGPIAEEIKRRNAAWGVEPQYVIDPSARNRATVNAEAVEGEFARHGIYCGHGQNDRAAGILEVKGRLQAKNLTVSRECRNLIWEFPRYRRDPNAADEFAAIKADDHLLDALRYAVMARAWGAHFKPQSKPSRPVSTPFYEPPYRGPMPTENPPLGAMS